MLIELDASVDGDHRTADLVEPAAQGSGNRQMTLW
jgi:hypothetical protein